MRGPPFCDQPYRAHTEPLVTERIAVTGLADARAMHWEDRLRRKASTQEGLVGKFQLRGIGCGPDLWWQALASDRWRLMGDRVLALAGCPDTTARRVTGALLDT